MPRLLGEKIAYARTQQQVTQKELEALLGSVKQSHISNVETGKRAPSLAFVVLCAEALDVTVDYLVRDSIPVEVVNETAQPVVVATAQPTIFSDGIAHQFGAKLRYQRQRRGWSQGDLTRELAMVTRAQISRLEAGLKQPSIEVVLRCADVFGITTDYWVRDSIPIEDETGE